jgi:SAM-dependent methyltransferase
VIGGIPRFVQKDDYLLNFRMEWTIHSKTPYDSNLGKPVNEYMFRTRIGFSPEMIKGKLVLDAGCGSGRLVQLTRKYGGTVVGLDYTGAIDSAARNLWPDPLIHLVQGDILNPPFKACAFDLVFSNGVIHHTPDPPRAFTTLVGLVRRGGYISVWVYPDEGVLGRIPNRVAAIYRLVATRIPLPVLYKICRELQERIILPDAIYENFFDVDVTFKKGYINPRQAIYVLFPFWSLAPFKDWRIMDTFDFLSAKYKFAYSYADLSRWCHQNKLIDIEALPFPVAMKGRKP